jgi:hypothetical protein
MRLILALDIDWRANLAPDSRRDAVQK